jgi:hypothetical protein
MEAPMRWAQPAGYEDDFVLWATLCLILIDQVDEAAAGWKCISPNANSPKIRIPRGKSLFY